LHCDRPLVSNAFRFSVKHPRSSTPRPPITPPSRPNGGPSQSLFRSESGIEEYGLTTPRSLFNCHARRWPAFSLSVRRSGPPSLPPNAREIRPFRPRVGYTNRADGTARSPADVLIYINGYNTYVSNGPPRDAAAICTYGIQIRRADTHTCFSWPFAGEPARLTASTRMGKARH